jgi:dUTP pyrophosphatase
MTNLFDPYLLGCLINFSFFKDDEGVFDVLDEHNSLQQLYHVNDLYKQTLNQIPELIHSLQISSKVFYGVINGFKCVYGDKISSLPFLPYDTAHENWLCISGMIDMCSKLEVRNSDVVLEIYSTSEKWLSHLHSFVQIPGTITPNEKEGFVLTYRSTNVIDLFGHLPDSFKRCEFNHLLQRKRVLPVCRVIRKDPDAILPSKSRLSDVGYDLSVIRKHKDLTPNTALYDSGIALNIPFKYYVEVVPRSSLSKSGYALANSVGIIDPGYKGNIYVALTRTDPDAPEIVFPFRCCQLIFRKQIYVDLIESKELEELGTSTRGTGGYGSTGNK